MKQSEFNKKFVNCIRTEKGSEEGAKDSKAILPLMKNFPRLPASRALEVYREDYLVRMSEALRNTYRSVHSVLGDEDFFSAALEYLKKHPSTFSDLDEYGEGFETFLQTHPLTGGYPFLPELAHFEWTFRLVFHSRECQGLGALELGQALTDETMKIVLSPSVFALAYNYSVESIYSSGDEETELDYSNEQFILMFKKNSFVKMHLLSKNQYEIVKNFHTPVSLSECIKLAPATMTPAEMQELFQILGTEQILLKSV